jgi:hypothetical protein
LEQEEGRYDGNRWRKEEEKVLKLGRESRKRSYGATDKKTRWMNDTGM